MTSKTMGRWLRALGSGLALLGLVVGIPAVSWSVVGWPLPSAVPDPAAVGVALEQGNVPPEVVVNALAVVVWVVWAQLTWAVVWEMVVNGWRLARGLRTAPAPLVSAPLNTLAVKLVSGMLAAAVAAGPSTAVTLPAAPTLALVEGAPSTGPEIAPRPAAAPGPTARWLVAEGDSLWSIARTALGDGARSAEVLALNPELDSARSIRPGLVLDLPLGADVPDGRRVPSTSTGLAARSELVEVVRGDSLWRLSEDRLEEAGLDPSPATILDQVGEVVLDNRAEIHHPDLIHPGQVLRFPGLSGDGTPVRWDTGQLAGPTGDATDDTPDPESNGDAPDGAVRPGGTGTGDPDRGEVEQPARDDPADPTGADRGRGDDAVGDWPTVASPGESGSGTGDRGVEPASTGGGSGSGNGGEDLGLAGPEVPDRAVYLGAAATLLAAGAHQTVRRRRRYRLAHRQPGTVPAPVPDHLAAIEQSVLRLGHGDTGPWLWTALASLSARPVWEGEDVAQPVLARYDRDQLTVELSGADPMGAPLPWRTDDQGRTWSLARDTPVGELASFHARPVAPTLVTVGSGTLLNLEAVGVLAVRGREGVGLAVARSIVHELATSPSAGVVDIRTTIGLDGVDAHHLVQRQPPAALLDELVPWLDETADHLAADRSVSAYAGRVITNGDGMAPVVVVTDRSGATDLAPVIERAGRRTLPVAVVVIETDDPAHPDSAGPDGDDGHRHRLVVEGDRVRVEPWRIEAGAQLLSAEAAAQLGRLLQEATDGGEEPLPERTPPPSPAPDDDPEPLAAPSGASGTPEPIIRSGGDAGPDVDPDGGLVVNLLGPVDVVGVSGELTSQQLSLLTYLACHGPTSRPVVVDALWDGQAISRSRFPNLLTELRSRIGRQHLPEMRDGRYELIDVTTDLARFEHLVARAERLEPVQAVRSLRAALDLVRGAPLTIPGPRFWTWVDDHAHLAIRIEAQVAEVAARAAGLARELGDLATASRVCEQGLLASPSDEHLVIALTEIYKQSGRLGSARRLVDGWEDRISRMECGEPSEEPRRRLAG